MKLLDYDAEKTTVRDCQYLLTFFDIDNRRLPCDGEHAGSFLVGRTHFDAFVYTYPTRDV